MNEKKLTDEELVKAYELCITDSIRCNECPYSEPFRDGFVSCNGDMEEDVLDLINRQKAEIERRTEERKTANMHDLMYWFNAYNECVNDCEKYVIEASDNKAECIRLQKQVDELNKVITSLKYAHLQDECKLADLISTCKRAVELSDEWKAKFKQAVKDTAKDICDLILEHWEKKQFVECDWLRVAIAEKYGVEVE